MTRELVGPSRHAELIAHVAHVGLGLPADRRARYWRGRRSFVRERLEAKGWPADDVDAEIERFADAVRAEADQARGGPA